MLLASKDNMTGAWLAHKDVEKEVQMTEVNSPTSFYAVQRARTQRCSAWRRATPAVVSHICASSRNSCHHGTHVRAVDTLNPKPCAEGFQTGSSQGCDLNLRTPSMDATRT